MPCFTPFQQHGTSQLSHKQQGCHQRQVGMTQSKILQLKVAHRALQAGHSSTRSGWGLVPACATTILVGASELEAKAILWDEDYTKQFLKEFMRDPGKTTPCPVHQSPPPSKQMVVFFLARSFLPPPSISPLPCVCNL